MDQSGTSAEGAAVKNLQLDICHLTGCWVIGSWFPIPSPMQMTNFMSNVKCLCRTFGALYQLSALNPLPYGRGY